MATSSQHKQTKRSGLQASRTPRGEAPDESLAQVRAARHPLGHFPLVVLSHGIPYPDPRVEQDWQALQRDLAGLSSDSVHIIATRSGHQIQLDQPDLVIAAIKQVLTGKV